MKKKQLSILLATALLGMTVSACAAKDTPAPDSAQSETPADGVQSIEGETEAETPNETEETPEGTAENDTIVTSEGTENADKTPAVSSPVSITFQETTDEIKADDGTVLLENSMSMPVVSIEGAEDIAAKINADIGRYFNLSSDTETLELAKLDYEASQADEDGGWFAGYSQLVSADVTRMDDQVLSLEVTSYSYTGGAHGNYYVTGLNYNVKTGEVIDLYGLTEDYEAFHAAALDYIVNLAETPTYQEKMFETTKADLDSALFEWSGWVFTQNGVRFVANPYAIGPYASGVIYFTLPYQKAYDLGLKEDYRYNGNFMEERYYTTSQYDPDTMEELIDGTPEYSFDLNGDGTAEGIAFYGLIDSAENGSEYGLYIDGKNWGDVVYSALGPAGMEGYLHDTYALYDRDPSDDTTEIAIMFTEFPEDDSADRSHYTYFFQYTADQELVFIERLDGYITNPMSLASSLASSGE